MRWQLGGHLGTSVSALVDGQLEPGAAERAWGHVWACRPCRRAVAQEGRVKTELSALALNDLAGEDLAGNEPSASLLGSLYSLNGDGDVSLPPKERLDAWAAVEEIERTGSGRRRAGLVLMGAGSVSAAVFGFASLSGANLGIGGPPASTPTASLSRPSSTSTPTTAVITPAVAVHGRLPAAGEGGTGVQRSAVLLNGQ